MQKTRIKLGAAIALIVSVLTGLMVTFFCLPKSAVFAEETADGDSKYTTVTEDLNNITSGFDKSNYPAKEGDYSLNLLTLAVNKSNELLVYVYQPAASENYLATSINIDKDGNGANKYKMSLIDHNEVFFKYKVDGLKIAYSDRSQTIEVVSIFRKFIKGIDKNASTESDNTILEVSFSVAQKITIKNGVVSECKDVEVIKVLEKYVGFIRYDTDSYFAGLWGGGKCVDSHFVAFTTDHDIDLVLSARLSFYTQDITKTVKEHSSPMHSTDSSTKGGNKVNKVIELNRGQIVQNTDKSKTTYKYNRVQTVDEFLSAEDVKEEGSFGIFKWSQDRLDSTAKQELKNKQFILRFYESNYSHLKLIPVEHWKLPSCLLSSSEYKYTQVSEVTLLTLEFERSGIRFKLNAVDNVQTGSDKPIGEGPHVEIENKYKKWFEDFEDSLKAIFILLSVAAVVYIGLEIFKGISGGSGNANININLNDGGKNNGRKKK